MNCSLTCSGWFRYIQAQLHQEHELRPWVPQGTSAARALKKPCNDAAKHQGLQESSKQGRLGLLQSIVSALLQSIGLLQSNPSSHRATGMEFHLVPKDQSNFTTVKTGPNVSPSQVDSISEQCKVGVPSSMSKTLGELLIGGQ